MPTVAVNAAGWRMEPPVSEAVAARHRSAATADAEPPDEPPGVSARLPPAGDFHGLVTGPKCDVSLDEPMANSSILSLPSITAPSAPQVGGDGRLVGRNEAFEDVRARRGLHAFGAEQVLHAERSAFQRPGLALGAAIVTFSGAMVSALSGVSST